MALVLAVVLIPAPAGASDDPDYEQQWGMELIGAPSAWSKTTGSGVTIGIVDTGVDLAHEDLAGKVLASAACIDTGGEASKCGEDGQDVHGHGTHVAGIAAADTGNHLGVAGVAPDARLIVARAFDADGGASLDDVSAAIRWLVDHGAQVVNLSLGEALFIRPALLGSALTETLEYAWSRGVVPVLASGNTGLAGLGIGSSDYGDVNALVVGAVGQDGRLAEYSSATGTAKWALLAPGGGIFGGPEGVFSTYWRDKERNQYESLSGTSMAAPHVTGAVALLLAQGLSPARAVERLLDTADSSVSCGNNSPTCRGLLDVAKAAGAR